MFQKRSAGRLFSDKTSGSMDLAARLNKFMERNAGDSGNLEKLIKEFREKGTSFQSIQNYLKELENILKNRNKAELKRFFKTYRENSTIKYRRIYGNSKYLLKNKKRIVTVSNSRTVLEFLKLWHLENKILEVIVPESRPMMEGRQLAKFLLKEGIKVIFITDFNIGEYICKSDAVIIGADSILRNGDAVNKTGSRSAAIIAKNCGKPFYVLAGSDKYSKKISYNPQMENSNEVWNYKKKNLKIINNYFEIIEKKLITKIISEKG